MHQKLNESLQGAYAYCEYFEMINIELPETFEESIVET
jgi:hypothetical protein